MKINHYFKHHDVRTLIFSDFDSEISASLKDKGIEHTFIGKNNLKATTNLVYHLSNNNYDIIHIYGASSTQIPVPLIVSKVSDSLLISRFNGYPGSETKWKQFIINILQRELLKESDKVIFNSSNQMKDILNKYGVESSDHQLVIPPGIPNEWFISAQRDEIDSLRGDLGISKNTAIIGSCITPRPVKRLDLAIELVEDLLGIVDIKYIVVGDSSYVPKYKSETKDRGISDSIIWVGHKDTRELYKFYSLFDVTIMTSDVEGFGQAISESYLCETPSVAFEVGGMSDQILHNKTGYLAPPGDVTSFSKYVEKLLLNPELRSNFGIAGKKYVEERFTLNKSTQLYENLLSDILS